jgi:putative ATP-binding cassette transporter
MERSLAATRARLGAGAPGHSTLAELLVGLYAPESGEIRINGRPISDEDREHYRQLFSVTFADVHLFEGVFGMESAGLDAHARDYLDLLELGHQVQIEGGRLSTTELS